MKAVIVAAGRSSRLYPLTLDRPKGLLPFGGRSIIERSLDLLARTGITEVVVVVGYQHVQLRAALGPRVCYVLNPWFASTNNMASLWLALPHLGGEGFVYLHGDVVYDEEALTRLMAAPPTAAVNLLVDFDSVDEEAMKVRVADGRFAASSKDIPLHEAVGEWTGLARFAPHAGGALFGCIETLLDAGEFQAYDTTAFNRLAHAGLPFDLTPTGGLPWCEIDTAADLARARRLFGVEEA